MFRKIIISIVSILMLSLLISACHNAPADNSISSYTDVNDLDVFIVNPKSGLAVASSVSSANNVEIIEYTFASSGNYNIRISPVRVNSFSKNVNAVVSWKLI